jgi:trigger factor
MQISRKEIDPLNSIITIKLEKKDFSSKVDDVLKNYRKKANIPGFRKGFVPMGLIKKQYQNAVTAEEVNKILQDKLNNFLKDEKIDILGSPLPVVKEDLDWKSETLEFAFELGISPKFKINLDSKKKVIHFKIFADEKMINDQLNNIRKQYGKIVSKNEIKESFEISALFQSDENTIKTSSNFLLQDIKGNKNKELIKASKPGDKINLKIKNLFKDSLKAKQILSLNDKDLSKLDGEIQIEIKEVNERILSELNQELFDKIYEPGSVKSKKEMKLKIAEGIEKQLEQQSDQKLLNDINEFLIENTKIKLPQKFLIKWMQNSGKEQLTPEQAKEEYNKSEKGIKYQLIEGKIISDNNLQVEIEEIKEFSQNMIISQMTQYGQPIPPDNEIKKIIARILSNKDEVKRIQDQIISKKLLKFYLEKAPLKLKKVSFESFIKEAYPKT